MKNGEGAQDSSAMGSSGMYQPGLSDVGRRIRVGEAGFPDPWCLAWYPCPSEPAPRPRAVCGIEGLGVGACLAADAYQTTGKCQCLPGHLSPSAWLPAAFCLPQKACSVCSEAAEPGQEGQAEVRLAFVYSHLIFGSCASDELPGA